MTVELISAEQFTLQELTELYNQTRVDYLVPMPMNANRLKEYIQDFDIALSQSCVAQASNGQTLGLSMLGVRPHQAWITRLGVLPATRRSGLGSALMDCMIENAMAVGVDTIQLEVIKNNRPAYQLFSCKKFRETGEYLVMRRAPHPASEPLRGRLDWWEAGKALDALQSYPRHLTWIHAAESMRTLTETRAEERTTPTEAVRAGDLGRCLGERYLPAIEGKPVGLVPRTIASIRSFRASFFFFRDVSSICC